MEEAKTINSSASEHALTVLEFSKILELLEVQAQSKLGQEISRQLRPVFEISQVWDRLESTEEAYRILSAGSPPNLEHLYDLRESVNRASKGGALSGPDVRKCGRLLETVRSLNIFLSTKKTGFPLLGSLAESLVANQLLESRLLISVDEDGEITNEASKDIALIRSKKAILSSTAVKRMQEYVSSKTRELLSDPIYTTRSGRYVLPLKSENRGKIKGIVHDTSASGATIYVEPEDIVQIGNRLRETEVAERNEINRILLDLSGRIGKFSNELTLAIEVGSQIDHLFARGRLAFTLRGSMPIKKSKPFIRLQGAKHPLIDIKKVVPLDIEIGVGSNLLITGANTGGKTIAMKTVGLAIVMAQSGLFPPAHHVELGIFSGIYADIGDEQSVQQSLSTFSGHLKNVGNALVKGEKGSIVLMDELGAGTDPAEGAALAMAILSGFQAKEVAVLASTHYGELKAFAYETPGFQNAVMEFDSKTLRPTYRLTMGAAGASHALKIAERYGIPKEIIEQAKINLGNRSQDISNFMLQLDQTQKQARIAQGEADRKAAELQKALAKAQTELAEAEEIRKSVRVKAAARLEEALRDLRVQAANIFDEVRKNPTREAVDRARSRFGETENRARNKAFGKKDAAQTKLVESSTREFRLGDQVKVDGFPQGGEVVSVPNEKNVTVLIGSLKVTLPKEKVQLAALNVQIASARVIRQKSTDASMSNLAYKRSVEMGTELNLRHLRAEDAIERLDKFLDNCVLAGMDTVRIVHGKGEGVLRKISHEILRKHPHVGNFREGENGEGGSGVTVVRLK